MKIIIVSASSDIGAAMTKRWLARDWKVFGTFRTKSPAAKELTFEGAELFYCDVSKETSIKKACRELRQACPSWDALIMAPGTQEPVGAFAKCNFNKWEESVKVNFTSQMRIVHELLPARNKKARLGPCVLFFAGGGTNNAPVNYSAYIISKIALIKMCELLDAEIPDTRFAIVGPGWVKTKIHQATLKAGPKRAGANYRKTVKKLASQECTSLETVMDHFEWLLNARREVMGGRNFSTVFDKWGSVELEKRLLGNPGMYKLRRFGNDWLVKND